MSCCLSIGEIFAQCWSFSIKRGMVDSDGESFNSLSLPPICNQYFQTSTHSNVKKLTLKNTSAKRSGSYIRCQIWSGSPAALLTHSIKFWGQAWHLVNRPIYFKICIWSFDQYPLNSCVIFAVPDQGEKYCSRSNVIAGLQTFDAFTRKLSPWLIWSISSHVSRGLI